MYKQPNPRIDFQSSCWYKDLWRGSSEYNRYCLEKDNYTPMPPDTTPAAYRQQLEDYLALLMAALQEDEQKASSYWTKIPHLPLPPPRYNINEIKPILNEIDQAHKRIKGCYDMGEGY